MSDSDAERRIVLVRSGELGIPFHSSRDAHAKFDRIPSGTHGTLLGSADDAKLLLVRLESGQEGYVAPRYVQRELADSPPPDAKNPRKNAQNSRADLRAAQSREECQSAYRERKGDEPSASRIASFNVRWFPDGGPGETGEKKTDIAWLACTLASTRSDAIALQEWKATSRAKKATEEHLAELFALTGFVWEIEVDSCPDRGAQHVALLWNTNRVRLEGVEVVGELNPKGSACEGRLRPGLRARVIPKSGRPFDLVSVHLKSGADQISYDLRSKSFDAIVRLAKTRKAPLAIAGDLNTMGCEDCAPPIDEGAERTLRERTIESQGALLEPDAPSCSHYYEGHAGLLDGFLLFDAKAGKEYVFGECAVRGCSSGGRAAPYFGHVSDHCPLAVDLAWD